MNEKWAELIAALTLLSKGAVPGSFPTHCEHDTLYVMSDPGQFSAEEIAQLSEWGFHEGSEEDAGSRTFYSFRFGSA